jgi:hypothetical protein
MRGLPIPRDEEEPTAMIEQSQKRAREVPSSCTRVPPNYGAEFAQAYEAVFTDLAKTHKCLRLPPDLMADSARSSSFSCPTAFTRTKTAQPALLDNIWKGLRPAAEIGLLLEPGTSPSVCVVAEFSSLHVLTCLLTPEGCPGAREFARGRRSVSVSHTSGTRRVFEAPRRRRHWIVRLSLGLAKRPWSAVRPCMRHRVLHARGRCRRRSLRSGEPTLPYLTPA